MKAAIAALIISQFLFADFLIFKAFTQQDQEVAVVHGPWENYKQ